MNKKLINDLQEEILNYKKEINNLKEDIKTKKILDTIIFILIFMLTTIIILGGASIFYGHLNITSILIQELLDIVPISLAFYLGARLVTSAIYGFNISNRKKVKNIQSKIKKNKAILKKVEPKNVITQEKTEIKNKFNPTLEIETPSYSNNNIKVKKIGAIER